METSRQLYQSRNIRSNGPCVANAIIQDITLFFSFPSRLPM